MTKALFEVNKALATANLVLKINNCMLNHAILMAELKVVATSTYIENDDNSINLSIYLKGEK